MKYLKKFEGYDKSLVERFGMSDIVEYIFDICRDLEDDGFVVTIGGFSMYDADGKLKYLTTHRPGGDPVKKFFMIIYKFNYGVGDFVVNKELTSTLRRLRDYMDSVGYSTNLDYPDGNLNLGTKDVGTSQMVHFIRK